MKKFVVLLLLVVAGLSQAAKISEETASHFKNECLGKHGVTEEVLKEALGGNVPTGDNFKDYLLCVGEKAGVFDADGTYHENKFKEILLSFNSDESKIDALLKKCDSEKGDLKEDSYHTVQCILGDLSTKS